MEQNSFISFADVKKSIFDPEILTLLAPSIYNPTPERLKHRAEKYIADSNVKAYACKSSEKHIGIVVFKTENDTAEILDIAVKPEYRKNGILYWLRTDKEAILPHQSSAIFYFDFTAIVLWILPQ